MPKVSVIIPVYNGEAYLRQCLDTVCAQTLEDIEIICVDDGSTDGSWAILEEYRKRDERFQLLRQENLHVAAARNNGLARAEGKYVIFWDCDDFFEPNALELLYQRAEETGAEVCVCNNDLYYEKTEKRYPDGAQLQPQRIPEGDTFNRFTNPEHIISFTDPPVWNKMFLREFLAANDIAFPPDIHYAEDCIFSFVALCSASKIAAVDEVLIHYRWNNPESLGNKISRAPFESILGHEIAVDQLILRDIVPTKSLGKRMLQLVVKDLHYTRTKEDFFRMLQYVREGSDGTSLLKKFDIVEREPGYYYGENDDEYVKSLLYDEPGDVLAFLMHDSWQKQRVTAANRRRFKAELTAKKEELRELKAERKALKSELKETRADLRRTQGDLEAIRNSWSFRLGRALLYIPRKLRNLFRRSA